METSTHPGEAGHVGSGDTTGATVNDVAVVTCTVSALATVALAAIGQDWHTCATLTALNLLAVAGGAR